MSALLNLPIEHIHQTVDYLTGAILLVGGALAAAVATGRVRVRAVAASYLLAALALGLLVAGVNQIATRALTPIKDPFSISELVVSILLAFAVVLLLPWLSVRYLRSHKTIESLRGGLEISERSAKLAAAEKDVISQQFAHSKQALSTTLEEAYRLAALVESSKDAIIGVNDDGTVWHWNQAAQELFKRSAEEMVGKSLAEIRVGTMGDLWRESLRLVTPPFPKGQDEVSVTCGDGCTTSSIGLRA